MRKLISIALLAALAVPAGASAQSSRELRHDRREIREQRQDVRQARRTGDRSDVRRERGDVREARQEYREDLRDNRDYRYRNYARNDWQGYRNANRALYARGNWQAPFRYNSFRVGYRIQPSYFGSRYWIRDPWRYRLPRPRPYSRWVRHYNDVLLVDYRRGIILDVIRGFYF